LTQHFNSDRLIAAEKPSKEGMAVYAAQKCVKVTACAADISGKIGAWKVKKQEKPAT